MAEPHTAENLLKCQNPVAAFVSFAAASIFSPLKHTSLTKVGDYPIAGPE